MPVAKTISKIIRQRKALLRIKKSGKSEMACIQVIQELELYMKAYGPKWNDEGWKGFARRNLAKLEFLIPSNKSGESIKIELYNEIN